MRRAIRPAPLPPAPVPPDLPAGAVGFIARRADTSRLACHHPNGALAYTFGACPDLAAAARLMPRTLAVLPCGAVVRAGNALAIYALPLVKESTP